MSLVLAVHFKRNIFEYFLPGINNRPVPVTIPSSTSGYSFDISLSLEVWNGAWRIHENSSISFSKRDNGHVLLENDLTLTCIHKKSGEKFTIVVQEHYDGYSEFDKYTLAPGRIVIGRAEDCSIQYDTRNLVSDKHAVLETDSNGVCTLTDNSRNGTFVNGRKLEGAHRLCFGDVIYIIGLKIVYLGDLLAVNRPSQQITLHGLELHTEDAPKAVPKESSAPVFYQRSPRRVDTLDTETIEIEAPPNPNRSRRQPLVFTVGPSMTMLIPMAAGVLFTVLSARQSSSGTTSPFMFMGIITSVTAALIGIFWALANSRYSKKTELEDETRRTGSYRVYLDRIRALLVQKHISNKEMLDKEYPAASECLNFFKTNSRRLWERNVNHLDFLTVRLGLGELASPNAVSIPKERFSVVDDCLMEEPRKIQRDFSVLRDVPVCISLQDHQLIGIIGESSVICDKIAQCMAVQIASYHSYTDVRMAFIYSEKNADAYEFAKWLPHTWSVDGDLRMMSCDPNGVGELFYSLSSVIRERLEERAGVSDKTRPLPHYVVFISDPSLVENEAVMKYLTAPEKRTGISTVLVYEQIGRLPNHCTAIIQNDTDFRGYYSLDSAFSSFANISYDSVTQESLNRYARELSGVRIRESQSAGAVPQLLTFLDMYKTSNVENIDIARRWLENRTYESMKAMIGYRGADAPLYLDIHEKYHGPHGLVAGTTGSGKSETLQTYILSLSLCYHPYEVSFILIDYKGGGMADSFRPLPHVAGIITNLGGNQTNRALASINSEIKRRQAAFNEYKLKHIDGYIELFRAGKASAPMPHLLIIADEFAELKKEQPEFVRELVSASRVGRSLGVHLILATQKPSGVVDDEIWGNSKFRLCLRVQDKQDSNEMIKRPDAAYITNAGRGYFQVGNDDIFETFQSGWSGAKYEPELAYSDSKQGDAKMINLWGKAQVVGTAKKVVRSENHQENLTQLTAVVNHISEIARSQEIHPIDNIWLPPLPARLALRDIREYAAFSDGVWHGLPGELNPVVGVADDPVNQRQLAFSVNLLAEGHLLVTGSGSGGKTTFLQTLLYSLVTTYSPKQLHMYIADFGSRTMGVFGTLPHVGGVVFDSQPDKADKLIALLLKELNRRKTVFSDKGIGSIKEYARLYDDVPFIVFAIDNFAAFYETCSKHEDNLVLLSREAAGYGIYLAVSCTNANDVRNKIRQNIAYGVGLQLADRFEYEEAIGSKSDIVPENHVSGRGLANFPKPLEFQTALCVAGEDAVSLNLALKQQFEEMSAAWTGASAPAIPQIPADLSLDHLLTISEFEHAARSERFMPLGYDLAEAQAESVELCKTFCYTISGTARSGKTNLFKVFIKLAKLQGGKVFVFDGASREMQTFARDAGADGYLTQSGELFDLMQTTIVPEFSRRNLLKAQFIQNGRKDPDQYIASVPKIFLFIHDMTAFCEAVYESERDMKGFLEQMIVRGDNHMIYLFACVSQGDMTGEYNSKRLMRGFIGWKEGIHLGGNVESQKVFDFDVPVLERGRKLPAGYGHAVLGGVTKRVVTPVIES